MSKNYKKIINEKKKYVFIILIFIFLIYFVKNFIYLFFQNKILSILNSSRFEKFIILRVENYLEKISEGELTEKQIEYYSNVLNRINQKFKPVLDKLKN